MPWMKTIERTLRRWAPTALSVLAAAGVGGTAVLAVKASRQADEIIRRGEESENSRWDFWRKASKTAAVYLPAGLMGLGTVGCIFGARMLDKRQQAALASAYLLMDRTFREYRAKTAAKVGVKTEQAIRAEVRPPWEDPPACETEPELFYEKHFGYFRRPLLEVLNAEYRLNRQYALTGICCLNDLAELLGLPKPDGGDRSGWSVGAGEAFYGYQWIDFSHFVTHTDDGLECCFIELPFGPTADYLDY